MENYWTGGEGGVEGRRLYRIGEAGWRGATVDHKRGKGEEEKALIVAAFG